MPKTTSIKNPGERTDEETQRLLDDAATRAVITEQAKRGPNIPFDPKIIEDNIRNKGKIFEEGSGSEFK